MLLSGCYVFHGQWSIVLLVSLGWETKSCWYWRTSEGTRAVPSSSSPSPSLSSSSSSGMFETLSLVVPQCLSNYKRLSCLRNIDNETIIAADLFLEYRTSNVAVERFNRINFRWSTIKTVYVLVYFTPTDTNALFKIFPALNVVAKWLAPRSNGSIVST